MPREQCPVQNDKCRIPIPTEIHKQYIKDTTNKKLQSSSPQLPPHYTAVSLCWAGTGVLSNRRLPLKDVVECSGIQYDYWWRSSGWRGHYRICRGIHCRSCLLSVAPITVNLAARWLWWCYWRAGKMMWMMPPRLVVAFVCIVYWSACCYYWGGEGGFWGKNICYCWSNFNLETWSVHF